MDSTRTASASTPGPRTLLELENGNRRIQGNSDLPDIAEVYFRDTDAERDAIGRLIIAAPDLREASQRFYDAVNDYLLVQDSELPQEVVTAMDDLEAAWHKADGTLPEERDD